jgi:hypothetical protein
MTPRTRKSDGNKLSKSAVEDLQQMRDERRSGATISIGPKSLAILIGFLTTLFGGWQYATHDSAEAQTGALPSRLATLEADTRQIAANTEKIEDIQQELFEIKLMQGQTLTIVQLTAAQNGIKLPSALLQNGIFDTP